MDTPAWPGEEGPINTATNLLGRNLRGTVFRNRLVRFAIVGGVGFLIEAGLLTYFSMVPTIGPIVGRGISFPLAVFTTWWLNRKVTFRSKNAPGGESLRYFLVQLIGALVNLAVFVGLVSTFPLLRPIPVVPLFMAAMVGLLVNFVLSKKMVFVQHEER